VVFDGLGRAGIARLFLWIVQNTTFFEVVFHTETASLFGIAATKTL
jgi:hypothetical protein